MHKLSMNSEFTQYNGLISRNLSFLTKIAVPRIIVYKRASRLLALRGWRTLCVRRRLPSVA